MKVTIEGNELVIRIDANTTNPPPSSTGKSLVVATTQGFTRTEVTVLGKPLSIGINAVIKK